MTKTLIRLITFSLLISSIGASNANEVKQELDGFIETAVEIKAGYHANHLINDLRSEYRFYQINYKVLLAGKFLKINVVDSRLSLNQVEAYLETNRYVEKVLKNKILKKSTTSDTFYRNNSSVIDMVQGNQGEKDYWWINSINAMSTIQNRNVNANKSIVVIMDGGVDYNHLDLIDSIWVNTRLVSDTNRDGIVNARDIDSNRDSKIENNEILALSSSSQAVLGMNFFDSNNPLIPLDATDGHGTNMAGLVAASVNNNIGIAGVAKGVKIFPMKVGGEDNLNALAVLESIDYLYRYSSSLFSNSRVVVAYSASSDELLADALELLAKDKNIIVVQAAGNDSKNIDGDSSNSDYVISVAATNPSDSLTRFSNYGNSIDICAPGGGSNSSTGVDYPNILTTTPGNINRGFVVEEELVGKTNQLYSITSGTSFSGPIVAGAVALLLTQDSSLDTASVKAILRHSGTSVSVDKVDAKLLNLSAALSSAHRLAPKAFFSKKNSPTNAGGQSLILTGLADALSFKRYIIEYSYSNSGDWKTLTESSSRKTSYDQILYSSNEINFLGNNLVTFRLTVEDNLGRSSEDLIQVKFENNDKKSDFDPDNNVHHNYALRSDVNDDNQVFPRDVLLIINALADVTSPQLDQSQPLYRSGSRIYVDVTNDGLLTPRDALNVINYLAQQSSNKQVAAKHSFDNNIIDLELDLKRSYTNIYFEEESFKIQTSFGYMTYRYDEYDSITIKPDNALSYSRLNIHTNPGIYKTNVRTDDKKIQINITAYTTKISLEDFKSSTVISRNKNDKLAAFDSRLNDRVLSLENDTRFTYGSGVRHRFLNFKTISCVSNKGGYDSVRIYDTKSNDYLKLYSTYVRTNNSERFNRIQRTMMSFESVQAYGYYGGTNYIYKYSSRPSYRFTQRGSWR